MSDSSVSRISSRFSQYKFQLLKFYLIGFYLINSFFLLRGVWLRLFREPTSTQDDLAIFAPMILLFLAYVNIFTSYALWKNLRKGFLMTAVSFVMLASVMGIALLDIQKYSWLEVRIILVLLLCLINIAFSGFLYHRQGVMV